jgi:hypothetical protein
VVSRICVSTKSLGEADAAGPGTTLVETLGQGLRFKEPKLQIQLLAPSSPVMNAAGCRGH